jgi:cytochrome c-type biogenesis protein CcmH
MRTLLLILSLCFSAHLFAADAPDVEEQTRAISAELRCVVCQNLSVADSPSDMAQQMRAIVREQVAAGKTPEEIKDYFVSKYGEWVLLAPTTKGFSVVVWVFPFVALVGGLILGLFILRGWTRRKTSAATAEANPDLLARVRAEAALDTEAQLDLEDSSRHSQLLQERARFYADLRELDFDFQAGKLSETDYTSLRRDIEAKAAVVLEQLDREEKPPPSSPKKGQPAPRRSDSAAARAQQRLQLHGWHMALGGTFLLVFGVTVGVLLMNSLRPRGSAQDSITGDFLTGTSSTPAASDDVPALLQEASDAFTKQEWPKAIDAVKKVLAVDPNQPEAHAYMGYILLQANHADGALMAFDKALAQQPNFPMALWGKGMALYQGKEDYAGARQVFEQLLKVIPAGAERAEVEKILAEIPQGSQRPSQTAKTAAPSTTPSENRITGKISVDPKLKQKLAVKAVLFIIARPGGGGPPVAVKKIDNPVFPLTYSLGSENAMVQGAALAGKLMLSARLDTDGNPMTRDSGSLMGEYKTPVEAGAKNVDFVMDQVAP